VSQSQESKRKRRLPPLSIEHLWALTVLVGIFVFVNTHPIRPHDFWWHMAVGREILATGRIPLVDTFSYTAAGTPYPSYQMFWLIETALYLLYRTGGAALVIFVHSLVITTAYGLLLWLGQRLSGSWRAGAFATLFAAALGLNDWNVRPQAVTFAIAALFLLAIHEYRQTARREWLLVFPLGMALWVNSHGTFPFGLLLLGLWLAEESWMLLTSQGERAWGRLRPPALTLGASLLACLINPRGWGIVNYVTGMSAHPIIQNLVPEWAPSTLDTLNGQLFIGGLLLSAALLALSPRRPTLTELCTFLVFGGLGLKTSRGIIWFGIMMAPVLANHLPGLAREARALLPRSEPPFRPATPPKREVILNGALAGLLLLGAALSLPWFKEALPLPPAKAGLISAETPVAATAYLLEAQPPGPLFHAMSFGSYLIWAAPEYPTFVDGRIELFPVEVWRDYLTIAAGASGWERRLEQYGIQTLLLAPQETPGLIHAARNAPAWRQVYLDDSAVIFTRAQ